MAHSPDPQINPHINQQTGAAHGSTKSYIVGLLISIVLTLIAFSVLMVEGNLGLGRNGILAVISLCAVAQICVQLICFMHMGSSTQWWNRTSFIFTLLTIAIFVVGSLWVMHHLHKNMHPGQGGQTRAFIQQSHANSVANSHA